MSRRALLLLLAGGIVIFTVMLVRSRLSDTPAVVPQAQVARIVVAKRDLMVGSFVQGVQDLDWAPAPDLSQIVPVPGEATSPATGLPLSATPTESYLYEGSVKLTDFNGAIVRRALHAGDPVPQSAIMKSGEGGFMSAVLEPGMRAVSIAVNATTGNAGFVSPGDRIDLIVTHRIKPPQPVGGVAPEEFVVSETFVRNVRVVAVDQMLDNPENKAILAKTLTIEVKPHQAEEIAVAADLGKISVALRSLASPDTKTKTADTGAAPLEAIDKDTEQQLPHSERPANFTRDSDISELLLNHKSAANPHVHVIHGDKVENMDFDQDKK